MIEENSLSSKLATYIDSHSYSNSKFRGYQLIAQNKVSLDQHNTECNEFFFKVKSQRNSYVYDVNIKINAHKIWAICNCPYNYGGLCKHEVAALTLLRQKLIAGALNPHINQADAIFNFSYLSSELLKNWSSNHPAIQYLKNLNTDNINLIKHDDGITKLEVGENGTIYHVTFQGEKDSSLLLTSCQCAEKVTVPCSHKLRALRFLQDKFGEYALQEAFDWSEDKKRMLSEFGYMPEDDYSKLIEFSFNGFSLSAQRSHELLCINEMDSLTEPITRQLIPDEKEEKKEAPGIALFLNEATLIPLIGTILFKGKPYKNNNNIRKVNNIMGLASSFSTFFSNLDEEYKNFYLWQQAECEEELVLNAIISPDHEARQYYEDIETEDLIHHLRSDLPFLRELTIKYIPLLKKMCENLLNKNVYLFNKPRYNYYNNYNSYNNYFLAKDLRYINVSEEPIKAKLNIQQDTSNYIISVNYYQANRKIQPVFDVFRFPWLVGVDSRTTLACWENDSSFILAVMTLLEEPPAHIYIPKREIRRFTSFINHFKKQIEIDMSQIKTHKKSSEKVTFRISLTEMGNFLLFYPLALYDENEVTVSNEADAFYVNDKEGKISEIKRDIEKEKSFYNFMVNLHPKFSELNQQEFFYLNSNEIMEGLWFLNFFEQCKNQGVEVYGFEKLKNIKYNPHKPTTSYHVESGIDWFDVKMDVKFGGQKVSLKEIRKSILNKQKAVKLDDGSTGILPEEWINKWLTALKFGKLEDDDTLKLSNLHFLLIEDLYKQLDDNTQRKEIHEKKKKLNDFKELKQVKPPEGLKATLRHYQEEGLSWLNFLCEFGWGGCLADDMGLGKTIQVLALIMHIKQKDKRKKNVSLVVAPTTLLFNWQAEIEKFCPDLRVNLHWGQTRDAKTKNWKQYDLILTTYGTLTNDIEFIRKFHFNLAILDESQAIKNPSSLRFKAVRLLNANIRLSLTGTPIENNTLELFAQMQYLNPGYLGSLHFFKKEFSNAIDKQKDKNQAHQLSKMIRPFILRRKKEDVAKELPDKTETTMFCEMEEQQRKVYEHFKEDIRQQLLSKIDEEGIEKARFNILEGLLKLRQICDSPALLNTREDYGNESVKAEELVRHIRNKTGKHKVLVFSQFIGMLQLIKNKLDQEKIKYAYLDGQTKNRQAEVHTFQNTRTCRVFLLSIKAGGLGLNLTKADYVYIIDPWWNPAVEAQAIDRTHRIGQEKHVFAYKMVCKDTIEEKIVQLQQNKQAIANDLISTDKGFVSNLSRGDIEELLI